MKDYGIAWKLLAYIIIQLKVSCKLLGMQQVLQVFDAIRDAFKKNGKENDFL